MVAKEDAEGGVLFVMYAVFCYLSRTRRGMCFSEFPRFIVSYFSSWIPVANRLVTWYGFGEIGRVLPTKRFL